MRKNGCGLKKASAGSSSSISNHNDLSGIDGDGTQHLSAAQRDWVAAQSYSAPAFSAFAISGVSADNEVGYTMAAGSHTFTWSISNAGNVQANSITILKDGVSIASGLANDGTQAVDIGSAITNNTVASVVFTIRATNTNGVTFSRAFTVNWKGRIYYGTSSADSITTEAAVEALANEYLDNNRTANNLGFSNAGDYSFIVIPTVIDQSGIGFLDPNTNFDYGMYRQDNAFIDGGSYGYQVSVTNTHGLVLTYNIYRSENQLNNPTTANIT